MEACFECRGLSKRFGSVQALDEVNISIMPGRVVGLLGPNGSGKTTLIKLANGLLTPDSGEIDVCGYKPGKESKALVSYLPDRPCLPEWMNTRQLMDLYADFYADFDRERAGKMLEHLNIPEKRTIKQMSKGTREKVQLIMVMSRRARLYLLDEPIGGVDPATRDYILDTIIRNYDAADKHRPAGFEPLRRTVRAIVECLDRCGYLFLGLRRHVLILAVEEA